MLQGTLCSGKRGKQVWEVHPWASGEGVAPWLQEEVALHQGREVEGAHQEDLQEGACGNQQRL